jgi:hypothetical protein
MEDGVDAKVTQAMMRHSTITLTVDRYTHLSAARQSDALGSLPDLDAVPDAAEMRDRDGGCADGGLEFHARK